MELAPILISEAGLFLEGSQHQSFEPQPIKLGGLPTNMQFVLLYIPRTTEA